MIKKVITSDTRKSPNTKLTSPGPYLAKVVGHMDPTYMGVLEVELLHDSGNDERDEGQMHYVTYLSPFAGQTNLLHVNKTDTYPNTQKSYGFWAIPPDTGVIVMCMFVDGDPRKGYWFGCVQDLNMNFMMPGIAATEIATAKNTDKSRVPVADYNKLANEGTSQNDLTQIAKPACPQETMLDNQGLLEDDARGITTSSARREVPSAVFGISTPGPIDKQGPKGEIGKKQTKVDAAYISRLTGSSFVMDDGDDKWERKKTPSEGPPEYANVEAKETGLRDRPHNELIRLRTRTGHQILLHNSEDLIYIGNARGTAWIELTSDGKIDVFSEDSITFRTKQDFNFFCDRDFNLEVQRNFNIKVHGEMHTRVVKDQVLVVERDQKIHIRNRKDETIDEQYRQTVNKDVKKFYKADYTHNVDGRMDFRVAKGLSFTGGEGPADPKFAPFRQPSDDGDDPCANDDDKSNPIEDHNGPIPDRIDIKLYKDTRIDHIGVNLDHTIGGYLKTKIKGTVDINTDSKWTHTSAGDIDVKAGGHIFHTSAASNETNAGGGIIETAPVIHMNGPAAGTAPTAAIADPSEQARISAKATIPRVLTEHKLPDLPKQDGDIEEDIRIVRRLPTYEPYPHHENLDPEKYKPEKTDRDLLGRYEPDETTEDMFPPASYWKKYSTGKDTFKR